MAKKSPKQSAKPMPPLVPQPNGRGALYAGGVPGNKGGGRPRDEWKAALRAMASADKVMEHVRSVLDQGPDHPYFDRALQYATDHGYGKAAQPIEHEATGSLADILTKIAESRGR